MKNNEANVFVFIAAIIIGILIALNINLNNTEERIVLNAKQYQEAYNSRNKLVKDIYALKDEYSKNLSKLSNYKQGEASESKIIEDISSELELNKMILGYKDVKGEGLAITIKDGSGEFSNSVDDPILRYTRTVHNTDMIQVINELRNSGAEAISINGQRIMPNSEIYCSWAFLRINGVKLPAPFYISVIGNKEVIKKYILSNDSYVRTLINRGIEVSIYEEKEVVIPSITSDVKNKYLSPSK